MALKINKNLKFKPTEPMYFESDNAFTDFCVAPYAVIEQSDNGTLYYHGEYTDLYKQCVEDGISFVFLFCERICFASVVKLGATIAAKLPFKISSAASVLITALQAKTVSVVLIES